MARPPTPPDWLEALRRPAPGLREEDAPKAPAVCTRCRRPAASLESRLERRRVRRPDPRSPGGFRYAYEIKEHLLCVPCYLEVRSGRPPARNHAYKVLALAAAGAVALAAALPLAMPNLLAAFWQNGAAPAEGHREGRSTFLQGRY
jgi:hypothetical protein